MDPLTLYGAAAVSAMLVFYALEGRSIHFVLAFAGACLASAIYGFLQGAWPFGVVESVVPGRAAPMVEPSSIRAPLGLRNNARLNWGKDLWSQVDRCQLVGKQERRAFDCPPNRCGGATPGHRRDRRLTTNREEVVRAALIRHPRPCSRGGEPVLRGKAARTSWITTTYPACTAYTMSKATPAPPTSVGFLDVAVQVRSTGAGVARYSRYTSVASRTPSRIGPMSIRVAPWLFALAQSGDERLCRKPLPEAIDPCIGGQAQPRETHCRQARVGQPPRLAVSDAAALVAVLNVPEAVFQ
jgi:hypothetical protein